MADNESRPTADPALARSMVDPLYRGLRLSTGEALMAHADGVAGIIRSIRNDPDLIAAAYLFCVPTVIQKNSSEWIEKSFGPTVNGLVQELGQINDLSMRARSDNAEANTSRQAEALRKMLLAMCKDLRVVLLKLASRLQTLRWFASSKNEGAASFGEETLALYAPLANRLGIWQIKWELEDLSLRFTRPDEYHEIARELDESREERLEFMQGAVRRIRELLAEHRIEAEVSGRPKHIYSIWKKMQRKHLRFDQLFDVRAVRIIVETIEQCYEVLSIVHESFPVLSKEYDDYIAKPKPNGYQSLHTVVTDKAGRPIEIQIRTRAMHEFAELGVAAHWRYKEAGNSNGMSTAEEQRVAWLRQLLAWRSDVGARPSTIRTRSRTITSIASRPRDASWSSRRRDTRRLRVPGAHRTRSPHARRQGERRHGAPQHAPAHGRNRRNHRRETGQPSRDWLNPDLGYAASARTRNKVRQWFNAQQTAELLSSGRERLDKELARLGKTAVKLEDLAKRLGYDSVDDVCVAFAKEEITATAIATAVQPPKPVKEVEPEVVLHQAQKDKKGRVLVVGVDSLLTQLARCCHPVPPDEIVGYVSRGRGVMIHRADCPNVRNMAEQDHERLIEVSWGSAVGDAVYPAEVLVVAQDRMGLLKDISEVFMREKERVTGMNTQSVKGDQHMYFQIEIHSADGLKRTLAALREVSGVLSARRV